MKVKNKYNYDYLAICLQASVVKRFRVYAKKIARSQSDALTAMLDFFEWHNYSPHQRFGKNVIAGQKKNRKRIEAVIAIIKSVEKSQNIPIMNIEAMLKSLFKEEIKNYAPQMLESKPVTKPTQKTKAKKTTVSRIDYDRSQEKLSETKDRLRYVLDQIELVSNRFGKDFLKIEITREELARFKRGLKDS